MKKFSTGKDLKIGEKPEVKNEKSDVDEIYYSIMELADNFLNVKYFRWKRPICTSSNGIFIK